jgi:hypothetical protein
MHQMESEYPESGKLIEYSDLAGVMAYKQADYRNLGIFAGKIVSSGVFNSNVNKVLTNLIDVLSYEGETEGLLAGQAYLQAIVDSAGAAEARAASEAVYPVGGETTTKDTVVDQADLLAYARFSQFWPTDQKNKSITSQVWQRLIALHDSEKRIAYGGTEAFKPPALTVVQLQFTRESPAQLNDDQPLTDNLADLKLGSLIELLAAYDDLQSRRPHLTTADILGKGFGPIKVAFLKEFVTYKLNELNSVGAADEIDESAV